MHVLETVAPVMSEYVPATQSVQSSKLLAPIKAECLPLPHCIQSSSESLPVSSANFPAPQSLHAALETAPASAENLPDSQGTQSVSLSLPGLSRYLPGTQSWHFTGLTVPSIFEAYFPAAHTISSGSVPLATPYCINEGVFIAASAIVPISLLPSIIAARTLTDAGDDDAAWGLVRLKSTTADFPEASNGTATVSSKVPSSLFQRPVDPRVPFDEMTAKLLEEGVSVPVSPAIVTVDPFANS